MGGEINLAVAVSTKPPPAADTIYCLAGLVIDPGGFAVWTYLHPAAINIKHLQLIPEEGETVKFQSRLQ